MLLTLTKLILLFPLCLGFVVFTWMTAQRLTREPEHPRVRRWLWPWTVKGLLVPLVVWAAMNIGFSFDLHAFMPQVQAAQVAGNWLPAYLAQVAYGFIVISSYWTALTLGWLLLRAGRGLEGETRGHFHGLCWTSLIGMFLPAAGLVWVGGGAALGLAALAVVAPVAGYAPVILKPKPLPPMYARAIGRIKFGQYAEAEAEVIRQLERCEDDFEGWMMLANLYANHFNDLPEAEQTVLEICDQPRTSPSQLSVALHRLADWHLKLAGDPEAARRALQMISDRLPGTHLARMARLRADNLPRTAEEWREQQVHKPLHLPGAGNQPDGEAGRSRPA